MSPFVAFFKVVPYRGKRLEYVRDLQRLAMNAYNAVQGLTGFNFAQPGGGQARLEHTTSDFVNGFACKPQFGNTPAQLMITGFVEWGTVAGTWISHAPVVQPVADTQVFCCNSVQRGQLGEQPWDYIPNDPTSGDPTAATIDEVFTVKADLESAMATHAVTDTTGLPIRLFRLIYADIIWGDRGHSFPVGII